MELRENSDHLVYLVMVNGCVLLGASIAYGLVTAISALVASGAFNSFSVVQRWLQVGGGIAAGLDPSNDFTEISHGNEILPLATGVLIYMITFKVIDYLREAELDLAEWRENLEGYVMVVVVAGLCSAIICILLMVLLLYPLGLLGYVWTDPAGLGQQFLFQLIVAGLAAGEMRKVAEATGQS